MTALDLKDVLAITIASFSLLVAVTSFVMTFRQRKWEDRRATRTALTDTISSLGEVNLAFAKLKLEHPRATDDVVNLRRTYNSQRRYLANHAEFLLRDVAELATEVDHNVLAMAFDAIGDYARAREQWTLCVRRSPAGPLRAMNLRGYGRFLFYQGNAEKGRQQYESSLQESLPDTDSFRKHRADTYLMWAVTERDFGYDQEARRRYDQAVTEARRIGHVGMKNEMIAYAEDLWQRDQVPSAAPGLPAASEPAPDVR